MNSQQIITENLWDLYNTIELVTQIEKKCTNNYSYINAFPSPWPVFVYDITGLADKQVNTISELSMLAEKKVIPPFFLIHPTINNSDLQTLLKQNGFKQVVRWPAMYTEIPISHTIEKPNYRIIKIDKETDLKEWYSVAEMNLFTQKQFRTEYIKLLYQNNLHFFAIECDNKIIGTSLVNITNNIAGLYMVSVLKEYRNKGLATFMVSGILKFLQILNVKYVVLEANAQSENMYSQLRFKTVGYFDIYWKIGLF